MSWHEEVTNPLRPHLARVRRRLQLGASAGSAVHSLKAQMGADAEALGVACTVHETVGCDLAVVLESLAAAMERRGSLAAEARSAAAGIRLSGRLVAALPLLLVPTLPLTRAPLTDGPGLVLSTAGILLALTGVASIEKLVPATPEGDDPIATIAELLSALLRSGAGLPAGLDLLCSAGPTELRPALQRARRRVRLGAAWGDALAQTEAAALGAAINHALSLGAPVAEALEGLARRRRDDAAHRRQAVYRRAPVLMVVPLTLFVLPSFVLLGVAPFLRGLSLAP
jgi:tight adherence protein B